MAAGPNFPSLPRNLQPCPHPVSVASQDAVPWLFLACHPRCPASLIPYSGVRIYSHMGRGDGSAGKGLTMQASGPAIQLKKIPGGVQCMCDSNAG